MTRTCGCDIDVGVFGHTCWGYLPDSYLQFCKDKAVRDAVHHAALAGNMVALSEAMQQLLSVTFTARTP